MTRTTEKVRRHSGRQSRNSRRNKTGGECSSRPLAWHEADEKKGDRQMELVDEELDHDTPR